MSAAELKSIPLCVDLDGTLIRTDSLYESLLLLLKSRPWAILLLFPWLLRGRAYFKQRIAAGGRVQPSSLPYNPEFLQWLRSEKATGRTIVLATAADGAIAREVADHLGLFDEIVASDGVDNVKGARKLARLEERFGDEFEYAGNARADLPIWRRARKAIAVDAPRAVVAELASAGKLSHSFERPKGRWRAWREALRIHQWSKNLLVFVPVLTSHRILEPVTVKRASVMFLAFSFAASALYIVNDLMDLSADRQHPDKRRRPFASGDLGIEAGLLAAPLLMMLALAVAAPLGRAALLTLAVYGCASLSYSLWLKSRAPLDVFLLTGLYTLRILAGGVVTHIWISGWLLSLSVFLFLSLAFSKRVSELVRQRRRNVESTDGRGYRTSDLEQVNTFGVTSGFLSSLVLAFYISSDQVRALYRQPMYLWLLFPILLYWLSRLWMLAWNGELDEDPVLYAVKSPLTYWLGCISLLLLIIAKFDLLAPLERWVSEPIG
jgi:4-hydroxybenzoate polyprenyltransferase